MTVTPLRAPDDALTTRQIVVLLNGTLLPAFPAEERYHGVYRSLVIRGYLRHDHRGGYVLTSEGRARLAKVSGADIQRATAEDIAANFPRQEAAE